MSKFLSMAVDFRRWIEDNCVLEEEATVLEGALYSAYMDWCMERGSESMSRRSFLLGITALGLARDRFVRMNGKKDGLRIGIKLRDPVVADKAAEDEVHNPIGVWVEQMSLIAMQDTVRPEDKFRALAFLIDREDRLESQKGAVDLEKSREDLRRDLWGEEGGEESGAD